MTRTKYSRQIRKGGERRKIVAYERCNHDRHIPADFDTVRATRLEFGTCASTYVYAHCAVPARTICGTRQCRRRLCICQNSTRIDNNLGLQTHRVDTLELRVINEDHDSIRFNNSLREFA